MFEDLINTKPKRYMSRATKFIDTCPYCKATGKTSGLSGIQPKGFPDDRCLQKYVCKICQKVWNVIIFIEKEATKSV